MELSPLDSLYFWYDNWTDGEGVKWTYCVPLTVSNGTDINYEDFQTSLFIAKNKVSGGQVRIVKCNSLLVEVP